MEIQRTFSINDLGIFPSILYMTKRNLAGVYLIKNLINGKVYIGSSHNLLKRFRYHASVIRNNGKDAQRLSKLPLYIDIRKIGLRNFSFEILAIVGDIDNLHEYEQYFINKFDSCQQGYNLIPAYTEKNDKSIRKNANAKNIVSREQLIDLLAQYHSAKRCGDILSVSVTTIKRICKRMNIVYNGDFIRHAADVQIQKLKRLRTSEAQRQYIDSILLQRNYNLIDDYSNGVNVKSLMKKYHLDASTVHSILNDFDVKKHTQMKPVIIIQDSDTRLIFTSIIDCATYLRQYNDALKNIELENIRIGISRVINGNRQSYHGYYLIDGTLMKIE